MVARLVAVAALLGTLPATAHARAADPAERLRETRDQLEDAREGLSTVEAQLAGTKAELDAIEGRLAVADAEVARLERELAAARDEQAAASARTAEVTAKLLVETQRLEAARAELRRREERFDRRVAAAYKYGTVTYADALVGSRSFDQFLTSYYYLRSALGNDAHLIDEVTEITRELRARRAEVDRLRELAVAEEERATAAAAEVARITAAQHEVRDAIAQDRAERRRLVQALEASRAEYEGLVAALQRESDQLAAELRRSRWRAGAAPGAGTLAWPTDGSPGSGYGWRTHPIFGTQRFHSGVDIAGPVGQKIVAAADGLVVWSGPRGGYGLTVVIDHGGGLATLYAHQSFLSVSQGEVVGRGQKIGEIGSTGYSTGPHLHFEVRVDGEPQDPMRWY